MGVTLVMVRHAAAGQRDRWKGDDRDRPLSKRGRRQAEALAPLVAKLLSDPGPPFMVLSSPWVRCEQTVAPLAQLIGAVVISCEGLGEGRAVTAGLAITSLSTRPEALAVALGCRLDPSEGEPAAPKAVVLCTHGDVGLAVLHRMASAGVDLGPEPQMPKGSVWAFNPGGAGIMSAAYFAPPA